MRALTLHLKLLIAILVVLGISVTAYQIFVLGIPVTEDATDDLWNIDAKVEAQAAKVEMRAAKVCASLTELYARQQALAESLDAFRPYATIDAQAAGDCRS